MESEHDELLDTFRRAKELNLCPNRLWFVARENLPKVFPGCSMSPVTGETVQEHEECTPGFCEYSLRDFTAVQQRHECRTADGEIRETCTQIQGRFPSNLRDEAALKGEQTVWNLAGDAMLEAQRPYMAISHVWADGTGTGAWQAGTVNECLYAFFESIAKYFSCEGIWWDTLSIPREKAPRTIAIQKIPRSYEDARITLVHDCFLRNWEWNPQTACFAILMSPWFSRGWTALELMNSQKIKVIFKGRYGAVIKDLDEEILAKEDEPEGPRKFATRIIQNLRKNSSALELNDLLTILRSRYTSWPKDMAVISALLLSLKPDAHQQKTYRKILTSLGQIAPGHLFHKSVTMSKGFNWCPSSLFDMPMDFSKPSLKISAHGDVEGKWQFLPADQCPDLEKRCWWNDMHPLIAREIQRVLRSTTRCHLLAECGKKPVTRALLVMETQTPDIFQYIGAIFFREQLFSAEDKWVEKNIIIAGLTSQDRNSLSQEEEERPGEISDRLEKETSNIVSDASMLHKAIWRGNYKQFSHLIQHTDLSVPDSLGRSALHLAAERGHTKMVQALVTIVDLNFRCNYGQTALHSAALAGSSSVVSILLQGEIDPATRDNDGNIALHIAARMGHTAVVKLLLQFPGSVEVKGYNGLTPLHLATINGHIDVAEILVDDAALGAKENSIGWTPLHCAADLGHSELARMLIERGADVNAIDNHAGWTPLFVAAINGHTDVGRLLLERGAKITKDNCGWTIHHFLQINGHSEALKLLSSENNTQISVKGLTWMPLHCRAINNQPGLSKVLISKDAEIYSRPKGEGWTPLEFAAENDLRVSIEWILKHTGYSSPKFRARLLQYAAEYGYEGLARVLINANTDLEAKTRHKWTPLQRACERGHEGIVRLLLQAGANAEATHNETEVRPIHLAASQGHTSVIQLLAKFGVNMEVRDDDGLSPLFWASREGHATSVQALLEAGADIAMRDKKRRTALLMASKRRHEAVVRALLEGMSTVDSDDGSGWTPLQMAVKMDSVSITQFLLKAGVDPERCGGASSDRPLPLAAESASEVIVQLLLDAGAAVNTYGNNTSPLHVSCKANRITNTQRLLAAGADVRSLDEHGCTPLHMAAQNGDTNLVQLLVTSGAKVDETSMDGETPLHFACKEGNASAVQVLLQAGANPEVFTRYDMSPLEKALESKKDSKAAVQLLLDAGVDIEATGYHWKTPIFCAIESGSAANIQLLIDSKANIEAKKNDSHQTPLFAAVRLGKQSIVQLLLDSGADIGAKDSKGKTAIAYASYLGHNEIAKTLRIAKANKRTQSRV